MEPQRRCSMSFKPVVTMREFCGRRGAGADWVTTTHRQVLGDGGARPRGLNDPTASQASSLVRLTYWSQAYSIQRPAFVHVSPHIPSSRLRHTGKMTGFIMFYLPRRRLCVREYNDDERAQDIKNCLSVLYNTQYQ